MQPSWLLFIVHLSGRQTASRMRLWRALKTSGAAMLRDGVYLAAESDHTLPVLDRCQQEIEQSGGRAYRFPVVLTGAQRREWLPLFDRSPSYVTLQKSMQTLMRQLPRSTEGRVRQRLAQLQTDFDNTAATDFFPTDLQAKTRTSLVACVAAVDRHFSDGEPHSRHGIIPLRDLADHQGRTWATRQHLWADRVASAWLIQRFIDKRARFVWLKDTAKCPKQALGFDFDNAAFTHVGDKVTFEVLLSSFKLQTDVALTHIAAMIHYLDIGGVAISEADGFAAILTGAKARCRNDNALLKTMTTVLDDLYHSFSLTMTTTRQQKRKTL
jgi:hypothetical protein